MGIELRQCLVGTPPSVVAMQLHAARGRVDGCLGAPLSLAAAWNRLSARGSSSDRALRTPSRGMPWKVGVLRSVDDAHTGSVLGLAHRQCAHVVVTVSSLQAPLRSRVRGRGAHERSKGGLQSLTPHRPDLRSPIPVRSPDVKSPRFCLFVGLGVSSGRGCALQQSDLAPFARGCAGPPSAVAAQVE